ncbi:hypothetical protein [Amphiplicatus metriothermophilus]|uniref:Uncharacterized protein n=1 Tax=Amphiplicatus metriothermophilus TaxID=1519374 RepID=A0A239PUB2_9PROT|nr:hypothetical protein [Amphiplicatus metriothermophilus]MBB5519218.1 hypothetical protein [Amphiplicatus metriothermophilus]SNT73287.1 hypothetical protein SAMN06297382_1685 [Amphiplicatus metriothermophilus]
MSSRIRKASRRHAAEMLIAVIAYAGVLSACLIAARGMAPGPVLTLLAVAPVLPMAYACFAFFRFYRSMDEMQRRVSADAAALTLMVGVLAAITLGFLKRFGVADFEDDMMWFGPFLIVVWRMMRFLLGGRGC